MRSRPQAKIKILFFIVICIAIAVITVQWNSRQPSDARNWSDDQKMWAEIQIDENIVHINNIRDFDYDSVSDYSIAYTSGTYHGNQLKRVWYVVEQFGFWDGMAHTFLSFEFEGPRYLAISIEVRKEKGETYSLFKGMMRKFELMYVVGTEEDLIKLRTNHRIDDVYLYPLELTKAHREILFLNMVRRINKLKSEPEFYHTIFNSCTTNLADHVEEIVPGGIPKSFKVIFPGYSDALAYELELISNAKPFDVTKKSAFITDKANACADEEYFSACIRR